MKILDVARYFIYLSYKNDRYSLTPLKLQKILYFAQGWSCVWDDKFLFNEKFEAWQYGPVNRMVYDTFKIYKGNEIPYAEGSKPVNASKDELETIETIWGNYGSYSAHELVNKTHLETPWIHAYNLGSKIENEAIRDYFLTNY